MAISILIVEDDKRLRTELAKWFSRRYPDVHAASGVAEATELLDARHFDLLLVDLQLHDGWGLDVLKHARAIDEEMPVIVMTAFPEVKTAVRAMQDGARDYLVKPFELQELHLLVERALEDRGLRRTVRRLERERERDGHGAIGEIIGESPAIRHVRHLVEQVAGTDTPVLAGGATGTGKELVADSTHRLSARASGPLIKVNCSAIPEHLLESELFGHEKSAFTDARERREGLFEMAHGGTLFLDEISEMKPGLQAKLLRVVEGKPFRRVGGTREIHTDVRIVAATNRNLPERIRAGEFRDDLYFRLNVFRIDVPALAERGDDVVMLAWHFLGVVQKSLRKGPLELTAEAERLLLGYSWPGNVRELRNVIERAAIVCHGGVIEPNCLPVELQANSFVRSQGTVAAGTLPPLAQVEQHYIDYVMEQVEGNLSEAARILGIARNTLKSRLRRPASD